MKKKILVVFTGPMELGGVERSLLGLLDAFDYKTCQVDLFLYSHHGPLFQLINPNVNLLPEVKELAYLRESFGEKIKHQSYYAAWCRLIDGVLRNPNHDDTWAKIMRKFAPMLNIEYDVAVGFFRPFDFIAENVKAKVKVGWIHTDYTNAGEPLEPLLLDYRKVDKIAAVSKECQDTFCSLFPELTEKTFVMENILSKQFVVEQSRLFQVSDEMPATGAVRLLSIGRFCHQKNFDNVPDICARLKKMGYHVTWYLIGFGGDEDLIHRKIDEEGVNDSVIILGKKENPYPYIKECDLYVQPSRYEGKAVTVREAQMLCKPVIITKYATAGSQVEDGVDGTIVPLDNRGCAEGIAKLLDSPNAMQKLVYNCSQRDYSNGAEIQKLIELQ